MKLLFNVFNIFRWGRRNLDGSITFEYTTFSGGEFLEWTYHANLLPLWDVDKQGRYPNEADWSELIAQQKPGY